MPAWVFKGVEVTLVSPQPMDAPGTISRATVHMTSYTHSTTNCSSEISVSCIFSFSLGLSPFSLSLERWCYFHGLLRTLPPVFAATYCTQFHPYVWRVLLVSALFLFVDTMGTNDVENRLQPMCVFLTRLTYYPMVWNAKVIRNCEAFWRIPSGRGSSHPICRRTTSSSQPGRPRGRGAREGPMPKRTKP